jgi:peroxiredoxin
MADGDTKLGHMSTTTQSATNDPIAPIAAVSGSPARDRTAALVTWGAAAVMLLTSVHHAYGARVYGTPCRYHVLLLAIPALLVIVWSRARLRRAPGDVLARRLFVLTTLAVPVLGIGAFEGLYNHVVKDVLYFLHAPSALMGSLFPPPAYEMPNDVFFEVTGVAQVIPGAVTARYLARFVSERVEGAIAARGAARIGPGAFLAARDLTAISGEIVHVPDADRLMHLQFRRFAGCPVCNLHLRSFVRWRDEIEAARVREVVVFHSSADELREHATGSPFALIADPDKQLYAEFGVESAARAVLDPRAWGAIVSGVLRSAFAIASGRERPPPIRPRGGSLGLPADFLIAPDGFVIASKYGRHADDQWSVNELLAFSRAAWSRTASNQAR